MDKIEELVKRISVVPVQPNDLLIIEFIEGALLDGEADTIRKSLRDFYAQNNINVSIVVAEGDCIKNVRVVHPETA